jgi:uncharacterized membrane protein (DUF4010 family)
MPPLPPEPWINMGEAILIGLIVGIERGADRDERHAGLRDFITIALAGGLCGLLNQPWVTVAALLSITTLIAIFHIQTPGRTGITTEIASVATFLLCVLTATPNMPWGSPLAIALTVVLALFLDARAPLRKFLFETVTEREYFDTLRFLAVIFVILPVLPDGNYGPYGFFSPKRVWMFVILVCTISWLGYFLQKFLGEGRGLQLTAILGGLGSTTATTLEFAREARQEPQRARELAAAAVLANAIQAPRLVVLLWLAGGPLMLAALPMLAAATVVGLAGTWLLARGTLKEAEPRGPVKLGNPLRITPAIKLGALFALVRLVARVGTGEFGDRGVYAASLLGGSVDVDAVAFSVAGLMRDSQTAARVATLGLLIALVANGILKTAFAYGTGGRIFGRTVLLGFVAMFTAAGLALYFF